MATQVAENNKNRLTPVIASGLTIVKFEANRTDLVLNGLLLQIPKQVSVAIMMVIGVTITPMINELNKAFKKSSSLNNAM
jgi:hypothetical protein